MRGVTPTDANFPFYLIVQIIGFFKFTEGALRTDLSEFQGQNFKVGGTLGAEFVCFRIQVSNSPECSTWHKFPNPGGAISTKNVIFPIQGAQF